MFLIITMIGVDLVPILSPETNFVGTNLVSRIQWNKSSVFQLLFWWEKMNSKVVQLQPAYHCNGQWGQFKIDFEQSHIESCSWFIAATAARLIISYPNSWYKHWYHDRYHEFYSPMLDMFQHGLSVSGAKLTVWMFITVESNTFNLICISDPKCFHIFCKCNSNWMRWARSCTLKDYIFCKLHNSYWKVHRLLKL